MKILKVKKIKKKNWDFLRRKNFAATDKYLFIIKEENFLFFFPVFLLGGGNVGKS